MDGAASSEVIAKAYVNGNWATVIVEGNGLANVSDCVSC